MRSSLFAVKVCAVVTSGREVLLVRRRDTGLWDLPGGVLGAGEGVVEALRRLVEQDTGAVIAVLGLTGIYTRQTARLAVVFRSHQVAGSTLTTGPHVTETRWVDVDQTDELLSVSAVQQIREALLPQSMWPSMMLQGVPVPRSGDNKAASVTWRLGGAAAAASKMD